MYQNCWMIDAVVEQHTVRAIRLTSADIVSIKPRSVSL
jgi:hypothetical protein